METENYWQQSRDKVLELSNVTADKGLSSEEAANRLDLYGKNAMQEKKDKSFFRLFLEQFKSSLIIILIIAAVISGILGVVNGEGLLDTWIILSILLVNATIGATQEKKAQSSLDSLKSLSMPHATVIRNGTALSVPTPELVPGDIVLMEAGNIIPADMRIIECANLKIQEASLTGESLPVSKTDQVLPEGEIPLGDRVNMAFSGSQVTYGRGKGVVTSTGMQTEIGKIAKMLDESDMTETPMSKRLDQLGKVIGIACLAICVLIFVIGVLYGNGILDMFMTAVSLAVAAIPEGLPAISTVVLAIGVQRLVKRNAIIRNLPSVETLGSAQVICTDKTGTLTQNKMTVTDYVTGLQKNSINEENAGNEEEKERLFRTASLCCDARVARSEDGNLSFVGDPTETALVAVAYGMGLSEEGYGRVAEIPFDSERKKMTTVTRKPSGEGYCVNVKGGLDEIIAGCKYIQDGNSVREITSDDLDAIEALNTSMANDALRVLAMAYKEIGYIPTEKECKPEILENALIFLGMTGMIDPERPEVKDAVVECGKAGIRPVMITGDHKNTAVAIARKIGILRYGDRAVTGAEIQAMSDEDLEQNVENISVYARVAPEHKVRIVNAWQRKGKVVAMTGDGVNDAPSLKQADIGTAMGITGTDVAKDASDMVLTDDNFATIVSAVEEGRRIYDNIVKSILFLLSSNIGEIILLFVASVFNLGIPLLPIQLLWINLVTDSLPALALSMDPAECGIMSRPPKDSSKGIMRDGMVWRMLYQGFLIGIVPFFAYIIGLNHGGPEIANTMAFITLIMSELFQVRNLHSNKECSFRFSLAYNKYLTSAILFSAVLALILVLIPGLRVVFHFVALDGFHWLMAMGLALVPNFIVNVFKILGFNGKE